MASLLTVSKAENPVPGRYIVTLKDDVSFAAHISSTQAAIASSDSDIIHEFDLINGYAGKFTDDDLNDLRSHPDIASIEQDSYGWLCHDGEDTQSDATWGLGRISSKKKLTGSDKDLDFHYTYERTAGRGVTVYVIDSGIDINHSAFGGRASWGKTFGGPWEDKDNQGHGTHCAGTAVSGPYGVAKASKVIAVKVTDDGTDSTVGDFVASILWVAKEAARTGVPSVASISMGYEPQHFSIDQAIKVLYDSNVTVVVSAGNDNRDAVNTPARCKEAITVAASNFNDTKARFSNYGAVVNIWAAGVNVISTRTGGGTVEKHGTSMATPHVAGFAAYLLGRDSALTPAGVATIIDEKALYGVLSGIPDGTVNKLLNGVKKDVFV